MVLYFWAYFEESGRESSEKCRVIALRVVGSDLLDHKRIEHAFASRVRGRGQYQRHLPGSATMRCNARRKVSECCDTSEMHAKANSQSADDLRRATVS